MPSSRGVSLILRRPQLLTDLVATLFPQLLRRSGWKLDCFTVLGEAG